MPVIFDGISPPRSAVEPWVNGLHGEMLMRAGKSEESQAILKGVIQALRSTPGPDAWSQGLFRLESLARNAMEAGDWAFAEYVAAQMIDHDAAYGGSHFATARVLQHKGDSAGARREIDLAKRYWKDADRDFPELKAMDEVVAKTGSR